MTDSSMIVVGIVVGPTDRVDCNDVVDMIDLSEYTNDPCFKATNVSYIPVNPS
jgi:hypothetical protein